MENAEKQQSLENLLAAIEFDIEADKREFLDWKKYPNSVRHEEFDHKRRASIESKCDKHLQEATRIYEKYPECSRLPMLNPHIGIGLTRLRSWVEEELSRTKAS